MKTPAVILEVFHFNKNGIISGSLSRWWIYLYVVCRQSGFRDLKLLSTDFRRSSVLLFVSIIYIMANSPEKGQKKSISNQVFLNVKNNHLMLKRTDDKRKCQKQQWKLITWLSLQVLSSVLAADRKCHFPTWLWSLPTNKRKHKMFAVKQFYLLNCTFAFSIKGGKPAGISNAVFKFCSSWGSLIAGLHVVRVWNGPTCSFSK